MWTQWLGWALMGFGVVIKVLHDLIVAGVIHKV